MEALKSYYEISPFFFCITASASLLFSLANMTMIFGGDDAFDIGNDSLPSDIAFKFFSTQSILAFFMGLGWAGLTATVKWNLSFTPAIMIALMFGGTLMLFTAFLMYQVQKLNHTTKVSLYSSLGLKAKVYSQIPEGGKGQVEVVVSGQLKVVPAVSSVGALDSFSEVEVVGVKDKNTLIVRPIIKNNASNNGESA